MRYLIVLLIQKIRRPCRVRGRDEWAAAAEAAAMAEKEETTRGTHQWFRLFLRV